MLVFSIPKPFAGAVGELQRRAAASWLSIADRVVLFGDDPELARVAAELGAEHVSESPSNERGTPFLDAAFREAARRAGGDALCFTNADVILTADLLEARAAVERRFAAYLMVGQTRDLTVSDEELEAPGTLRERALREGVLRGPAAIDWFLFSAGLFGDIPAFLVGRASFDNWLLWRARQAAVVVDATGAVVSIHQSHDYLHLPGGKDEAYYGPEAEHNVRLAGGRRHVYTLHDASHRLTPDLELRRNLGSILRTRETARKVRWKLGSR